MAIPPHPIGEDRASENAGWLHFLPADLISELHDRETNPDLSHPLQFWHCVPVRQISHSPESIGFPFPGQKSDCHCDPDKAPSDFSIAPSCPDNYCFHHHNILLLIRTKNNIHPVDES